MLMLSLLGRGLRVAPWLSIWRKQVYKSSGRRPVRFAMRTSMRGPISSGSWKAQTKPVKPSRWSTLCEPLASRLTVQPMRRSAANTREARVERQWLTRRPRSRS